MPFLNTLASFLPSISDIVARLCIAIFILPFHELAHGYVANKLGDPTAKWMGRLTLNPVKHLDPVGSVLMLITGFGWAKPVPINPRNFKNEKKGMAITAAAGPLANFLMALGLLILAKLVLIIYALTNGVAWLFTVYQIIQLMASINISLGVFNLFPIPPLDGSRIVGLFLPDHIYFSIMKYEQYILYGFMALIMFTNIIDGPIYFLSNFVYNGLDFLTGFMDLILKAILGGM